MIDIESRKVIDMIESRERKDVKEWLSSFRNIMVVSRDGSKTFRNAIKDAHKNCLQISDRFHIVKNLVTALKSYLRKTIPGRILIPMSDKTKELKYQFFFLASKREKKLMV
jgi:transposase